MPAVTMGSAERFLRLSAVEWPGEGEPETRRLFLQVELHVQGEFRLEDLSAVRVVIPHGRDLGGLVEFFDDVAECWQDLELGELRAWRSFLHELEIEAQRVRPAGSPEHRGPDYVILLVTVRDVRAWEPDVWAVTAKVALQPADQLQAIARGVHELVGALE